MGVRGPARWGLRRLLRTGGVTAGIVEELDRLDWTTRAIRRIRLPRTRPFRLAGTRWRIPEPPSMAAVPDYHRTDTDYPEWPTAPRVTSAAPPWTSPPPGTAWRARSTGPAWPTPSLHDIRTAAARTTRVSRPPVRPKPAAAADPTDPATMPDTDGVPPVEPNDGPADVAGGATAPTADIRHNDLDIELELD